MMNIFEKLVDWAIIILGLLLLVAYGLLFELFTFWRYALPENHWLTHPFKKMPIPDVALDKHNDRGRRLRRGWAHFFEEGTLLANKADVSREAEFREAAKKAISNPSGDSLFGDD